LTLCLLLRETCGSLAVRLLPPFLEDRRETGYTYAVDPEKGEPRLPTRICDEAAESLAATIKGGPCCMERSIEGQILR
jgi:hypothetical protein